MIISRFFLKLWKVIFLFVISIQSIPFHSTLCMFSVRSIWMRCSCSNALNTKFDFLCFSLFENVHDFVCARYCVSACVCVKQLAQKILSRTCSSPNEQPESGRWDGVVIEIQNLVHINHGARTAFVFIGIDCIAINAQRTQTFSWWQFPHISADCCHLAISTYTNTQRPLTASNCVGGGDDGDGRLDVDDNELDCLLFVILAVISDNGYHQRARYLHHNM